jgi:hypothetical protein
VDAHPQLQVAAGEGPLRVDGGLHGVLGTDEDAEERVALRIHLLPAVVSDGRTHGSTEVRQRSGVGGRAESLEDGGRALDIHEQHRHRAGRKLAHGDMMTVRAARVRLNPMALQWESAKKLMRLQGMSEELVASARASADPSVNRAVLDALTGLARETQAVLETGDAGLAAEFERVVVGGSQGSDRAEVLGAALSGWLRAALGVEALDERRDAAMQEAPPKRKQTIGFKIRSPITREPE